MKDTSNCQQIRGSVKQTNPQQTGLTKIKPSGHQGILLSAVMPCLDEAETLRACIQAAQTCIQHLNISGEIIVADNGSSDGSQAIANEMGARVVNVPQRGYGAALAAGIGAAKGKVIVMADSDSSYDWSAMGPFIDTVLDGNDLVMGNRFKGGIKPGAMPVLHRYLGNPILSFLGRLFFKAPVGDFHCGMRAFLRESILKLNLQSSGMEFASEMIVKATLQGLRIAEVPVELSPDGRSREPHLRTWRDGWRHLRFLLLYSPRWLFLVPGLTLFMLGALGMLAISGHSVAVFGTHLDIHTLLYSGAAITLGFQMIFFAIITKLLGQQAGWLPYDGKLEALMGKVTLEACLVCSAILFFTGILLTWHAFHGWLRTDFSTLDPRITMRSVIPAVTAVILSGEIAIDSFFLEVTRIRKVGAASQDSSLG